EGRQSLAKLRQRKQQGANLVGLVPNDSKAGNENPLLSDELAAVAARALRADVIRSTLFLLYADRPLARAGACYELIPRSQGRLPSFCRCLRRARAGGRT